MESSQITVILLLQLSGAPLLQTRDTRSRCFRYTTNQCDYEPICLTVTIVKEPQSGLLAYYLTISGKLYKTIINAALSLITLHRY